MSPKAPKESPPTNQPAAASTANVRKSTEKESDPCVAIQNCINECQQTIRNELEKQLQLENRVQDLTRANRRLRAERDQLRLQTTHPDEALLTSQHIEEEHQQLLRAQRGYNDARDVYCEELQDTRDERDAAMLRADLVQGERDRLDVQRRRLEYERDGFELERNHYWEDRDRLRDENAILQAQLQALTAQLAASQAPAVQPPVDAAPGVVAPVVEPPVDASAAGPARGGRGGRGGGRGGARRGARGRAGCGGRGAATPASREQPKRACKVEKSYRV